MPWQQTYHLCFGWSCCVADVFSFGVVLWELLTWEMPWSAAGLNPWQVSLDWQRQLTKFASIAICVLQTQTWMQSLDAADSLPARLPRPPAASQPGHPGRPAGGAACGAAAWRHPKP